MKNLNTVSGTYCKLLSDNLKYIDTYAASDDVSLEAFRADVLAIIEKANLTPAKRGFIANVMKQRSKIGLLQLCYNACLSGADLAVI